MNKRSVSIDAIFCAASEIASVQDRQSYLHQTCRDDDEVRRRVERLLDAHFAAGGVLDSPQMGMTGVDPDAFAAAVASSDVAPGSKVGPYELLESIGQGGMGVVYKAEQLEPVRRTVALKLIKLGMDTREVLGRFRSERQALAMMDHPGIAKVLDASTTDAGRPYFVMELVNGTPITDHCDATRLTTRQRLQLFIDVCHAVQHAHQKGVIHRDLKPSNVLVTLQDDKPVPRIIDFGIAKAIGQAPAERTQFTHYGHVVGTPAYMSPEQAQFSGLDVDTRSDVYSLGVLLYELLTGTTPFDKQRLHAAGADEMRRIIREEDPPKPSMRISTLGGQLAAISAHRQTDPRKLGKAVRGELDWIVMKALEKDRTRRYDTAVGLARDVERYLRDEPVQACPPSATYRLRKFARRNKTAVLAASAMTAALLLATVVLAVSNVRITSETNQKSIALREREMALSEKAAALAAARLSEAEAKDQLFRSLRNEARARRLSHRMGQRVESLAALAEAARIRPDEALRDEAIAVMAQPDVRLGPTSRADSLGVFDRSYRLTAQADPQGGLSIRSVPDNREVRRIQSEGKLRDWSLSGDGQFVAQMDESFELRVWRVADGQPVLQEPLKCRSLAFSPDNRQLAVGRENLVLVFELATGRETARWEARSLSSTLAFHPDSRKLAVGYSSSTTVASVYDASNGAHLADLPIGPVDAQVVAWHPDGNRLAVAGSDPRIQVWDVAAKRKLATLEGTMQQVTELSFHPDGELLASNSWESVVRLWHAPSGRLLMQLPVAARARFSDDGRWLGVIWNGDHPQLLEMVTSPEYRTLISSLGANQGDYYEGDISPDGRLLAMGMGDGVRVWDLPSSRELAFLPTEKITWQALFAPDGRELLACGGAGLRRWPVIDDQAAGSNGPRLGVPHALALPVVPWRAAHSPDGRTLAVVSEPDGAAVLVDTTTGALKTPLLPHPGGCFVALSPDRRWIATGGWHSQQVRLWSAADHKMVHEWAVGSTNVFFTPDSRTLILSQAGEFSFWDVETLKLTRRVRRDVALFAGHVAFSGDGKLMALEMAPGVIHLKEVATARTVAKLEDPNGDRAVWIGFTPDGTQLAVTAQYARAIHVWDLRAIRTRLKTMGLDWDWPEFPPATKPSQPSTIG